MAFNGILVIEVVAVEFIFDLRPLLKYKRRNAVADDDDDVLKPSLSEPLEALPPLPKPALMPLPPFICTTAATVVWRLLALVLLLAMR